MLLSFLSENVVKAAEWYRDNLGFTYEFTWGEPPFYSIVQRDHGISIHFSKRDGDAEIQPRHLYVFCHDVDAMYEELKDKDLPHLTAPNDADYGMRDFEITDPYGNEITFGTNLDRL